MCDFSIKLALLFLALREVCCLPLSQEETLNESKLFITSLEEGI